MSNISEWSTVAASNNSAAPNGAPEGMSPASVNDTMREMMAATRRFYEETEWRDYGDTPTRTGNTTFTVPGDQTANYTVNRPIRCTDSSTLYGYITGSTYSAVTTCTVSLDSGNLSASLSAVALGATPSTQSIPVQAVRNGNDALLAADNTFSGTNAFQAISATSITLNSSRLGVLSRDASEQTVSNSTTETTVFTYTVPAGTMGTSQQLRFIAYGTYLNNSGSDGGITWRLKLGGTTFATLGITPLTTSASNRGWVLEGYISNQGAANAQRSHAIVRISAADADGDSAARGAQIHSFKNSLTIDTSANADFVLTVDHDNADANISITTNYAILHIE